MRARVSRHNVTDPSLGVSSPLSLSERAVPLRGGDTFAGWNTVRWSDTCTVHWVQSGRGGGRRGEQEEEGPPPSPQSPPPLAL